MARRSYGSGSLAVRADEDYRGYLRRHLVPFFGERTVDRIEPAHIEDYMHGKLATFAPKTVTNHLTFLHGLFAFALRRRWPESNPVGLVDRPPATRQHATRIRFLQPVEVEAVLRAVLGDELGPTDAAVYLCAVTTGLRQGELLALKWLDVDWARPPHPGRRQLPARPDRRGGHSEVALPPLRADGGPPCWRARAAFPALGLPIGRPCC